MGDDPFLSVKAILDGWGRSQEKEEKRMHRHIENLRNACTEIIKIESSEPINGLELAKKIAANALAVSDCYYDGF